MPDLPTAITVYVPREGSHLRALLAPKTGIVGSNAGEWLGEGNERKLLIDYQPVSTAVNIVTFADRCYHAYDRHVRHYPTHQRMLADAEDLWPVAFYWAPEGRVQVSGAGAGLQSVLTDGQAFVELARWTGHPTDDDGLEALHHDMQATHRAVWR